MDQKEQGQRFVEELQTLIQKYRIEYDLTLQTAIGGLEVVKLFLFKEETNRKD